jgi:hypothetical protein
VRQQHKVPPAAQSAASSTKCRQQKRLKSPLQTGLVLFHHLLGVPRNPRFFCNPQVLRPSHLSCPSPPFAPIAVQTSHTHQVRCTFPRAARPFRAFRPPSHLSWSKHPAPTRSNARFPVCWTPFAHFAPFRAYRGPNPHPTPHSVPIRSAPLSCLSRSKRSHSPAPPPSRKLRASWKVRELHPALRSPIVATPRQSACTFRLPGVE